MALSPGPHSCPDEHKQTTYQGNFENTGCIGK